METWNNWFYKIYLEQETKQMTKKRKCLKWKRKRKREEEQTWLVPSTNSQLFRYYWEIERKNGRKVDSWDRVEVKRREGKGRGGGEGGWWGWGWGRG